jgi:hypothetical protein
MFRVQSVILDDLSTIAAFVRYGFITVLALSDPVLGH